MCFIVLCNRNWFNRVPGPVTNLTGPPGDCLSTLCPYSQAVWGVVSCVQVGWVVSLIIRKMNRVQSQSAVGREALRMRADQSRALEGWCPCSQLARDVEIHLEICTTPGNPALMPKRICPSLAAVSALACPRHSHTQSRPKDHPFQHQVTTPMPPSKLIRAEPSCSVRWDAGLRLISTKLMSCE